MLKQLIESTGFSTHYLFVVFGRHIHSILVNKLVEVIDHLKYLNVESEGRHAKILLLSLLVRYLYLGKC